MTLIDQRIDISVIVDESKCLEKYNACVLTKHSETSKAYMKYDECWFCLPCENTPALRQ